MKKTVLKTSYYRQPTAIWMRVLGDFLNYASAAGAVAGSTGLAAVAGGAAGETARGRCGHGW